MAVEQVVVAQPPVAKLKPEPHPLRSLDFLDYLVTLPQAALPLIAFPLA